MGISSDELLEVTLPCATIRSKGKVAMFLVALCYRNRITHPAGGSPLQSVGKAMDKVQGGKC